jgi:bisphosphoglycerate-independent phosphoglycerate mutase (AlkP superfamily)
VIGARERNALYALYKPNVSGGPNFGPANNGRGWNSAIAKALEVLGLDSPKKIEERFRVMDRQAWDRSEERLDEINAEGERERAST